MEVEKGLGLDNSDLVRIGGEGVNVQLVGPCLKINVTEGLQTAGFILRKLDKNASVSRKSFEVLLALLIQAGRHLFDLEIGHVTDTPIQGALVILRSP